MVLLSDGKGHGKPARLVLTKDILTIQSPANEEGGTSVPPASGAVMDSMDASVRVVSIEKGKDGLGLSIKGGAGGAGNQSAPVVVSKVIPGFPAAQTGQIFVGDKILEVNGTNVNGLTHEEVVKLLKDATGNSISLTVQQELQMAPLLR